ncbi:MAG TPA: hypothetical protein VGA88_02045 [Burkholderiales bacterium]
MAKLTVLIGGDDRELQAALRRAQSGMRKFGAEAKAMAGGAAVVAAAAIAAATAMAVHLVAQSMKAIDAQAKMAGALNTSVASLAALERAADLDGVSVQQLETGMRKLATVLGEAAQGTGTAVDSLKRLHVTAAELAALPVDQRIALINQRIAENIPLAEQAAVSADFFGERAGLAMRNLSPETIKEATEQTKLFGHALSDVDAKKVEMANDSISTVGFAVDGLWKQISVKLAPIIGKIGEEFMKAAEEAGGMEKIALRVFDNIVTAAGFVVDSVDFIGRRFSMLADLLIIAKSRADTANEALMGQVESTSTATGAVDQLIGALTGQVAVTGESARKTKEAESVITQAWEHIQETLMKPLPSEALKQFVRDAEEAATKAADAALAGRQKKGAGGETDGLNKKERDALQKKLDSLRDQFKAEDELLFDRREKELEDIVEFEKKKLITAEEAALLREDIEQAHWERIGDIHQKASDAAIALEKAKNAALKAAQDSFFNNMAGLMNTESRKLFDIGKIAAISQAAIKTTQAVIDAWQAGMSVGGPWAPAVAAAYATAAALNGANLINNIRKQQFGGGGGAPTAPTQGSSGISPQGAGGGSIGAAAGGGGQSTVINLQGEFFSRDTLRKFIESLNEEGSDGARFILA